MCGASSGICRVNGLTGYAGKGGCISSNFSVTSGETLTVNVGGVGDDNAVNVQINGGFNGGGKYVHVFVSTCIDLWIYFCICQFFMMNCYMHIHLYTYELMSFNTYRMIFLK